MKEFSKIIHAKASCKWQDIIQRLVNTGCNNSNNFQEHIHFSSFVSCENGGILKTNKSNQIYSDLEPQHIAIFLEKKVYFAFQHDLMVKDSVTAEPMET